MNQTYKGNFSAHDFRPWKAVYDLPGAHCIEEFCFYSVAPNENGFGLIGAKENARFAKGAFADEVKKAAVGCKKLDGHWDV
jgi:hypothetical protein